MPSLTGSYSVPEAATQDAAWVGSNILVYGRLHGKLVRQMQTQSAAEQAVV